MIENNYNNYLSYMRQGNVESAQPVVYVVELWLIKAAYNDEWNPSRISNIANENNEIHNYKKFSG